MNLSESSNIVALQFGDGAFVDHARCDQVASDQLAEPSRRVRVVFVVEGRHAALPSAYSNRSPAVLRCRFNALCSAVGLTPIDRDASANDGQV